MRNADGCSSFSMTTMVFVNRWSGVQVPHPAPPSPRHKNYPRTDRRPKSELSCLHDDPGIVPTGVGAMVTESFRARMARAPRYVSAARLTADCLVRTLRHPRERGAGASPEVEARTAAQVSQERLEGGSPGAARLARYYSRAGTPGGQWRICPHRSSTERMSRRRG